MKTKLVISCEHGGNTVPLWLKDKVQIPQKVLNSHRGFDKGALEIALRLGKIYATKPITNEISRLVIDYNRSLHNKSVWSKYSQYLSDQDKNQIIAEYQHYREKVEKALKTKELHLSIHSFTPIRNGEKRNCDFSLLYDPSRKKEKELATKLKSALDKEKIKCRFNYPYQGKSDGLTSYLRKKKLENYIGIELEFNQNIVEHQFKINSIIESIQQVLN